MSACAGCGARRLPCGCCEGVAVHTPQPTDNGAGLVSLQLRVGTHGTFLASMLARLTGLVVEVDGERVRPLDALATRDPADPALAVLDGWATIADVLTFYQERIGVEGYLRTARERRSIVELARLVGYRLRPGVAAGTHVAFTLDPGFRVTVPAGTRAQSVPQGEGPPAPFETSEDIEARTEWNTLPLRRTRVQALQRTALAEAGRIVLAGTATGLKPNDGLLVDVDGEQTAYRVLEVTPDTDTDRTEVRISPWATRPVDLVRRLDAPLATTSTNAAVLALSTVLEGLAVPPSMQPRVRADLVRTVTTALGPASDAVARLFVSLQPATAGLFYAALAGARVAPPRPDAVYALRAKAGVFGNTAPEKMRVSESGELEPAGDPAVLDGDRKAILWLDAPNDRILPGGWVVVHRVGSEADSVEVLAVRDASVSSRSAYGVSAKGTRLLLDRPWVRDGDGFGVVRRSLVLAESEAVEPAEEPLDDDVSGDTLELAGVVEGLRPGQWLAVAGERADLSGIDRVEVAEAVMVAGVDQVREGGDDAEDPSSQLRTVVALAAPLAYRYRRSTTTVYGNVARATHGETREEPLGSGDGAQADQQFRLAQSPLTYVASPTPAGASSTLEVRVDGVRWDQRDDVAALGPADRAYSVRTDDEGRTFVTFGDGRHGTRLPTGVENVRARYRFGIGQAGNVGAGEVSQLATRPLGLRGVLNPVPATGGADPEDLDAARENAPTAVLALDRLVSVHDYADFARTFAGVGKASAARLSDGRRLVVQVTVAGIDDVPVTADGDLLRNLRAALRAFGDPSLPVVVRPRELVLLVVAASVAVDPRHQWVDVEAAVRAALVDAFGFRRRRLGQDVVASEVVAAMQAVRGVDWVDLDALGGVAETTALDDVVALADTLGRARRVEARGDRVEAVADAQVAAVVGGERPRVLRPAQLVTVAPAVTDTLLLREVRP